MAEFLKPKASEQEENHWLSVSDLMAGLMVVFLFIAIALMRDALIERDRIKEVAVAYQETQVNIYKALMGEFSDDLPRWDAEIDKDTLTFTFNSPEVLFARGKIELSDDYQELLSDFFPRYMEVLNQFKDSINEVRIEGHTSSVWNNSTSPTDAYFLNMALSQGRTRSVLEYVYRLAEVSPHQDWIKSHVAAVGFSSAKPVLNSQGTENFEKSRRVTFRVISNADIRIKQILEIEG
ncbi:OmpA/MotB family protein [Marinobacter sp. UBA3607]|mgnify:CR=1 FL=1|jgi:outer membrane protein OmpA-like peptidoglycan-associated protein|uniref:OmpA/MotB family protein n=1 Tax=Marinobacter sp. UBA3607 TaxID=1946820 RepID=UPI00257DB75B|nr:OmpA family protein [Marinobacter sp. UBA3607]|tara:strand:+ start:7691 stop:8398 length:708 start_codon:yes stop_codon:yes gene_type:complete